MIRRSDGDGVDIFVLEQLADIDVGFGLWQSQLIDVPEATVQHGLIDITERSNFCPWDARKAMDVIVAATSHSANCHLDAVIRAHDFCVAGCCDAQRRAGDAGASDF